MKKINDYKCIAYIFCLFVFGFVFFNMIAKDKQFSKQENRILAQKPNMTLSSVADGTFMKEFENYQSDQFVGRNVWMQLKTSAQSVLGIRESNGVWKGKQQTLLEVPATGDGENVRKNMEAIHTFSKENANLKQYFMLVPNAAYIWKDRIPMFYTGRDQGIDIQNIKKQLPNHVKWIDAVKSMQHYETEEIYYKTDHHWTSHGAYYTFLEAKEIMELDSKWDEKLEPYPVTNTFNGTLSSKSGYFVNKGEVINVWLPRDEGTEVVVQNMDTGKKKATLYDTSKLKGKDKYGLFLGDNVGAIDISTTSEANGRLLILKDSYANCFVPFLVPYYREIIIVDPRYYAGDLKKLIAENNIDSVLFLYNANTFFKDNNLKGVLCPDE